MTNQCPECDSLHVSSDGEPVFETIEGDKHYLGFYGWWLCEACGHQWRYQDDGLNPGGRYASEKQARISDPAPRPTN